MSNQTYTTLFLDIGGVLLTNGWDRHSREEACKRFNIDFKEMDERHSLAFFTYEVGHITLDEYLDYSVFYQSRNFTPDQFKEFMYVQSQPFTEMLNLIKNLKAKFHFKVVGVSNEGRELADYRIETFKLNTIFDMFIFSSYVQLRKPDPGFYRIAIDLSQVKPEEVIYIDDRPLLVEIGRKFGFRAIHHTNYESTKKLLEEITKG